MESHRSGFVYGLICSSNWNLAGMPPQAMRARCGAYRHCPNPLGFVTAEQLDKLEFGGESPLTMRTRCSAFRYCPDPLGIVTFFLQHLFFAPYNGQYPKEVSLAVNQTTLFGIAERLMYVQPRDETPLDIAFSSFF